MKQHFRITGSAHYLPRTPIYSSELDAQLKLAPGTTYQSTGIQVRYQAGPGEDGASMARRVIMETLESADCDLESLDLIIDASLCLQQPLPCNAALIQEALGPRAAGVGCMDVHASCLGFIAALKVVNGLLGCGAAKKILVVCSETPLRGVNWDEPDSACLMGDGAAAILFENSPSQENCALTLETFAEGARLCEVRGGGHRLPSCQYHSGKKSDYLFHMEGRRLHRLAGERLPSLIRRTLEQTGDKLDDLEIVPHQASGPAIRLMAKRLKIRSERLHASIEQHGNLVAASIPYVLHSVRQIKESRTRVMVIGTAAGYTQGVGIFSL